MTSPRDIFNSLTNTKYDEDKLVGSSNFFNNKREISESNKLERKFISNVDYTSPKNFARFGSAEEYYKNCINYIDSEYPYDGSTDEKLKWINSLNEFEYHVYDNEYPRSTGYVTLSGSQYIEIYSHVKDPYGEAKSIYNAGNKYTSNTVLNMEDEGFTFEGWMKFDTSNVDIQILKVNAFKLNQQNNYEIVDILTLSRESSNKKFCVYDVPNNKNYFDSITVDNEWHHYAFYICSSIMKLWIDGQLKEEKIINLQPGIYRFVPVGLSLWPLHQYEQIEFDGDRQSVFKIGNGQGFGGKFSIDEVRLWNKERSVEKIGRYWFTNVDGNDFSDPDNSNLLFYYKFNEGWDNQYLEVCLDYSGRKNDADIRNYLPNCRSPDSGIDLSGLAQDVEKPEIILRGLSYSQVVKDFYNQKILNGKAHDEENLHLLYNKFPGWILEQEEENSPKHLKQIIQIISSYFDDLYNKIKEISDYKTLKNTTDLDKIYPFYDKILTSAGFDVTELFTNLDIVERVASRNDTTLFDENIQKIKNSIFQNIYNNLSYILKSKGTEKSIKSFLRSYGINEDLIKINLYSNNLEYNLTDRSKEQVVKKKSILLKDGNSVYQCRDDYEFLEQPSKLDYFTLETAVSFPSSLVDEAPQTSSIFGLFQSYSGSTSFTDSGDHYYVTVENNSIKGSRFILNRSGSTQESVSSSYYQNLYDDSIWSFALRKKPKVDTIYGASNIEYSLELYGVNKNTHFEQTFVLPINYEVKTGEYYISYFIGSRNNDLEGVSLIDACSKFFYCNFWGDYLNNEVIDSHNKDILNYGTDE